LAKDKLADFGAAFEPVFAVCHALSSWSKKLALLTKRRGPRD
jgi:hypothetical protein